MLAKEEIKRYPYACEEAVEWINSLGEGVTAEEAWEICPSGPWMAWIASKVGVPEEERWVWVDLARVWAADILDREGVGHKLRECSPVVDKDSAHAVVEIALTAADFASNSARVNINAVADVACFAADAAAASFSGDLSAEHACDAAFIYSTYAAGTAKSAADMIRKRIKNPFRRDLC